MIESEFVKEHWYEKKWYTMLFFAYKSEGAYGD
jgi:ribosomal protein S3AE